MFNFYVVAYGADRHHVRLNEDGPYMSPTEMWPMNCSFLSIGPSEICTNFRGGLLHRRQRIGVELPKLLIFH